MAYVKFIGKTDAAKYKDEDTFRDVINYIGNPLKVSSVGSMNVTGFEKAAEEMETVAMQARSSYGKKICHIVISF